VKGGKASDWMVLLCLESIEGRNVWDDGSLAFLIRKDNLSNTNFDDVMPLIGAYWQRSAPGSLMARQT